MLFRTLMHSVLLVAGVVTIACPAAAKVTQDEIDCYYPNSDPDKAISGCTRLLETRLFTHLSARAIYKLQGQAWSFKGEWDRAIADYNAGLKLDSKSKFAADSY